MLKTLLGYTLAVVVLGLMAQENLRDESQSIYISHIYVYDSKLPTVSGCGGDYDCEVALDRAWAEAMSWDKLIDERVYP